MIAADAAATLGIDGGADGLDSTLDNIVFTNLGITGGTLVIDGSGELVYTPPASVDNSGGDVTETFEYTVTDEDGDSVTRQVTVDITDGGNPTLTADTNLVADEDDLPAGIGDTAAGDDASVLSGSLTFTAATDAFDLSTLTLSTGATGLTTLDGETVITSWDSVTDTLTGYTTDINDPVFEIVISNLTQGGADYTLTLYKPVEHVVTDDPETGAVETAFEDNQPVPVLQVDVSLKDTDGSEGTTSFTVEIDDDVPIIIDPDMAFLVNQINAAVTGIALDLDDNIDDNVGADQLGTLTFTAENGSDSGFTSNMLTIYLYVSADGQTIIGSTTIPNGAWTADDDEVTDNQVFTLSLNTDGSLGDSNDSYDFTLHQQIDGGQTVFSTNDGSYDFVRGNDNYAYYNDDNPDPNPDILLTPVTRPGYLGTSINGNASEAGVGGGGGGQDVGSSEGIRVDFVINVAGSPNASDDYPDGADHTFDSHAVVNGAQATLTSQGAGNSNIAVRAYSDLDGDFTVGDGTQKDIIRVVIGGTLVFTADGTQSGVTVDFDADGNGGVEISNVADGTTIQIFTLDGLTTLEFDYLSGNTFSLGNFGAAIADPGDVINMDFGLQLTDADGDTVVMEDGINIQLSPEDHQLHQGTDGPDTLDFSGSGQQALTLIGGAGDDELIGAEGNDILIGGAGNDILTGNEGVDVFDWNQGDEGEDGSQAIDIVTDFDAVEGDILDLADLLEGETDDAVTLDNYLSFSSDGTDTTVSVSTTSGGPVVQQIILEGVDLNNTNVLSDQQVIQNLLDGGNLRVDES